MSHKFGVTSVAFGYDGLTFCSGGFDGTAQFWDAATGIPCGPPCLTGGYTWLVLYSPNRMTALTAEAGAGRLWDVPRPGTDDPFYLRSNMEYSTCYYSDAGVRRRLSQAEWSYRLRTLQTKAR